MEKIVENCPWIQLGEDGLVRCCAKLGVSYQYCTGPNCAPAYWAKAMVESGYTFPENRIEVLK